jgi:predicted dienelactone hydrolase
MLGEKRSRWLVIALAIAFLGAGCGQGAADESLGPATRAIRQSLDTFPVGHTIQVVEVRGTSGETRPVDVHIWYPATPCSEPASAYTSRLNGVPLLPQWDPLSWQVISNVSREGARISQSGGPFPVIVFSHGANNDAIDYARTLETLASHGFVVAAPDHVGNTQDDVRIDFINAEAKFQLLSCFDGLPPPCARTNVPNSMTNRIHDVSAVLDALPDWFGNRVDVTRAGIMGHLAAPLPRLQPPAEARCGAFSRSRG